MKLKVVRNFLLVASAFCASTFAHAGSYSFEFLSNDSSYQVDGIFTTDDVLNVLNGYKILDISGTVSGPVGGTITALVPNLNSPGTNATPVINGWYITFDNNLFPNASPVLNSFGVAFYTAGGATWNIFSSGDQYELFTNAIPGNVDKIGALSVTAVPEPESYAMMLAGLALMGTIVRRRKIKTA